MVSCIGGEGAVRRVTTALSVAGTVDMAVAGLRGTSSWRFRRGSIIDCLILLGQALEVRGRTSRGVGVMQP